MKMMQRADWATRAVSLFGVFLLMSGATLYGGEGADKASANHVVVISVDGLGARWLSIIPEDVQIPNMRRLMAEGSVARGVHGVYPSVTYPSHTTMVTGRLPAEHGIYANLSSREAGKNAEDWYWYSKSIQVPTLWDVARKKGVKTSAIFWPVTVGSDIDWHVPEFWDPLSNNTKDPLFIGKYSTPGLLFEAALEAGTLGSERPDATKAKIAAHVIKKHKPGLLLLHLTELDGAQHRNGPGSADAEKEIELQDSYIGMVLQAVEEAGLEASTTVFIVSDHGFFPVNGYINPNVLLTEAGLVTVDAKGKVTGGKVFSMPDGGSFFISWPEGSDLRPQVEDALKPLRDQGALYAELGRDALKELGVEPAVQLALEAPRGAAFDDNAVGEVIRRQTRTTGTHGYLPYRQGMESTFVAWGPRIKSGQKIGFIPMTMIAPTLLKALGIEDEKLGEERPLNQIFK